ncbi:protein stoned-A-like [Toxorhynchites rutilus septentrionalis]|uniref:protein stoned-A-like n=1 Tax=Toxorhynchites rutilus septentrionalis TaxID=329112 RepID=UPI00247926FF|nr:protein stoned-A-like [Toxorhynchites rutilus septentrionalis]
MLKLPKGLKKKKKGKKSKKDQELFTEEELEQYRREHQTSALNSAAPSDSEDHPGEKSENDEEWSKFAALTTGIDSVLKKTQVDLDRIKESSFFQKVPTKVELEAKEKEERLKEQQQQQEQQEQQKAAEELINAVVELSESEPNSEAEEDIFDTDYIDAIASGELPIAYVPESPVLESFEGPDPFDTSYAEKIIKGPEVSKRGKKIVNIGAAVEVLTGRVENVSTKASIRRPRRGPENLLLESFDEGLPDGEEAKPVVQEAKQHSILTLLDDPAEVSGDVPIDLSVSLHLAFQKEQDDTKEEPKSELQLNFDEFDDLCKRQPAVEGDNFELLVGEVEPEACKKPARPPPPRPATGPRIVPNVDEEEFDLEEDDPFDTGFVERVLPATVKEDDDFDPRAGDDFPPQKEEEEDDFDFDPRGGEDSSTAPTRVKTPDLFSAEEHSTLQIASFQAKDLLSGSCVDLTDISQTPLEVATAADVAEDIVDPFDTSAVNLIVAPGKTELKFLEKEFLSDEAGGLKHSLSDPDFDPRADTEPESKEQQDDFDSIVQRKSSLSLHINSAAAKNKTVLFAVPTPDLLKLDGDHSVTKKPLTPYYSRESSLPESETLDPFDTTFVPSIVPSQLELNLIEKELNNSTALKHSLSDPDFDPRADSEVEEPKRAAPKSDLLGTDDNYNQKVLTPAQELEPEDIDPFDTSIAVNIQPGRAELRLLENEFNSEVPVASNQDFLSDSQDSGSIFVKVLTPQLNSVADETDIDPFDTSFAVDLGPGRAEIKLLENELIAREH